MPEEENISYLSREEMKITETGQVMTAMQGETVFSLNLKEAQKKLNRLADQRNNSGWKPSDVIPVALQLSGYRTPAPEPRWRRYSAVPITLHLPIDEPLISPGSHTNGFKGSVGLISRLGSSSKLLRRRRDC